MVKKRGKKKKVKKEITSGNYDTINKNSWMSPDKEIRRYGGDDY